MEKIKIIHCSRHFLTKSNIKLRHFLQLNDGRKPMASGASWRWRKGFSVRPRDNFSPFLHCRSSYCNTEKDSVFSKDGKEAAPHVEFVTWGCWQTQSNTDSSPSANRNKELRKISVTFSVILGCGALHNLEQSRDVFLIWIQVKIGLSWKNPKCKYIVWQNKNGRCFICLILNTKTSYRNFVSINPHL